MRTRTRKTGIKVLQTSLPKRQRCDRIAAGCDAEMIPWRPYWQELRDFVDPVRARFNQTDRRQTSRRNLTIIESTVTLAHRTLRTGMSNGITPASAPWCAMQMADPGLNRYGPVRRYTEDATERFLRGCGRTNFYSEMGLVYGDAGAYATAAMSILEDEERIFRCEALPIGTYSIAVDRYGRVNTLVRHMTLSANQILSWFGGAASAAVRRAADAGDGNSTFFEVIHAVYPNPDWVRPEPGEHAPDIATRMRFCSDYWEVGTPDSEPDALDHFLLESGFHEFPYIVPRWQTMALDPWGASCPAMISLGDVMQLQQMRRVQMNAVEKKVDPALNVPLSMKNGDDAVSLLPGGLNYVDANQLREGGVRPVHDVTLQLADVHVTLEDIRRIVNEAYYKDAFLQFARSAGQNELRVDQVAYMRDEQLLQLSDAYGRFSEDGLDPGTERILNIMWRAGALPPPIEELAGREWGMEYRSAMATAQRIARLGNIERWVGGIANIARQVPGAQAITDIADWDQVGYLTAEQGQIPPSLVRDVKDTAKIRITRARQQQAEAAAAQAQQLAGAARDLSQSDTSAPSALTSLVGT